jgi:hypothetical protein
MNTPITIRKDLFLLHHPFYQAWVDGTLPLPALKDYARQYFFHVDAFPSYLSQAIELATTDSEREVLRENLEEENGTRYGVSHPELWMRFAEGIGVSRDEMHSTVPRPAIQKVVDTFTSFSKSTLPRALGALYAYESQVPDIADSKITGLQKNFQVKDERTLEMSGRWHFLKYIKRRTLGIGRFSEQSWKSSRRATSKTLKKQLKFLVKCFGTFSATSRQSPRTPTHDTLVCFTFHQRLEPPRQARMHSGGAKHASRGPDQCGNPIFKSVASFEF